MASDFSISSDFPSGEPIPTVHTCGGENTSPSLRIDGVPENTGSLALIMDDPDAPKGTFVHWVVFNLPADTSVIRAGIDVADDFPNASEGMNDFGDMGYGGPCPPPGGPHHYHFRLYALDSILDLSAGATKKQVTQVMDGHVLAEANLIGTYQRGQ